MPVRGGGGISTISRSQLKQQFEAAMLVALGTPVFLWTPSDTETTTSVDGTLSEYALTHSHDLSSLRTKQGSGNYITFSTRYSVIADNAAFTFGNGTTDSAFTMMCLASIVDSAANRALITKAATNDGTGSKAEYEFMVDTADKLLFRAWSNGTGTSVSRLSDSAITQGAFKLFAVTNSGGSGATAMNNVKLFQNAVEIASTATNDGSYTAMNNTAAALNISRDFYELANFYPANSPIAMVAMASVALTAAQQHVIKKLCNAYFGLSM